MYAIRKTPGTSTVATAGGRLRVITSWPAKNGITASECAEEYDAKTDELLVRRWRSKTTLGGWTRWEFEIGDAPTKPASSMIAGGAMKVSRAKNPVFIPQDSSSAFIWRIRNLPYPKNIFQLSVDEEKQQIVLRTTNKKYFKRFDIPALKRLELKLDPRLVSCEHSNQTLKISYEKVPAVREVEAKLRSRRNQKMNQSDSPSDCKQQ